MHQRKPAQRRHHDRQRGEQSVGKHGQAGNTPDRCNIVTAVGEAHEKRSAEAGAELQGRGNAA
jgi:hypothetical protein